MRASLTLQTLMILLFTYSAIRYPLSSERLTGPVYVELHIGASNLNIN